MPPLKKHTHKERQTSVSWPAQGDRVQQIALQHLHDEAVVAVDVHGAKRARRRRWRGHHGHPFRLAEQGLHLVPLRGWGIADTGQPGAGRKRGWPNRDCTVVSGRMLGASTTSSISEISARSTVCCAARKRADENGAGCEGPNPRLDRPTALASLTSLVSGDLDPECGPPIVQKVGVARRVGVEHDRLDLVLLAIKENVNA